MKGVNSIKGFIKKHWFLFIMMGLLSLVIMLLELLSN